jgi:serine/threonine protein kinase/tetratricopeptide (TPR) repeat protein
VPSALRIVEEIVDLPAPDRPAAIERLCGGDPALRREVEELLALDESAAGFLEPPTDDERLRAMVQTVAGSPTAIGPYRVLREVGRGGFGIVYEGEQREPIERRVALKVIKPGMDSAGVLRRFAMERRTLAQLEHPNIARVLDAGLVPEGQPGAGRPFFAMEFVDGLPITEYADREGLGLRERLGLVTQVGAATQHAHTKGIIHRDLKPANILVATGDGAPVCKVIDFGVAKALGDDGEPAEAFTALTNPGAMIGTPQYMSPEQAQGEGDLDTRTDVYAIGVVLYELLCGATPFDEAMSGTRDPGRIRSAIESGEPAAPSARLGRVTRAGGPGARTRPSLDASALRGELDWITMKAIARDPARRYASASALADDLRRYLADEPVEAGPESRAYRISKFVRRNRVGVIAGGIAAAGVLAGSVFSVAFGVQAVAAREAERTQRVEAERNAAIAQAVNDFLRDDLLSAVDPTRTADRDITMREVLDKASESVGDHFADQPLVEAAIRATLALTYERIGYPVEAEPHRRRELEIYTEVATDDDKRAVTARTSLAANMMVQSRFDEAVGLLTRNIELVGDRPEYEQDMLTVLNNLSAAYLELGRYADAAPILAQTLEAKRRELGDRDPSTLTSIFNLAGLYYSLADVQQAERLYREAYEGRAEVLGDADPKTISSVMMLGRALFELKQYDESDEVLNRALGVVEERLDPGHPMRLSLMEAIAESALRRGEPERADPLYAEVIELRTQHQGPDHALTIHAMGQLAITRFELGRFGDALSLVEEASERQAGVLPEGHWSRAMKTVLAGRCHAGLGHPEQAEPLLVDGLRAVIAALGPDHQRALAATDALIEFYQSQGRGDEAATIAARRGTDGVRDLVCSPPAD